jgi:hypothetical protein
MSVVHNQPSGPVMDWTSIYMPARHILQQYPVPHREASPEKRQELLEEFEQVYRRVKEWHRCWTLAKQSIIPIEDYISRRLAGILPHPSYILPPEPVVERVPSSSAKKRQSRPRPKKKQLRADAAQPTSAVVPQQQLPMDFAVQIPAQLPAYRPEVDEAPRIMESIEFDGEVPAQLPAFEPAVNEVPNEMDFGDFEMDLQALPTSDSLSELFEQPSDSDADFERLNALMELPYDPFPDLSQASSQEQAENLLEWL